MVIKIDLKHLNVNLDNIDNLKDRIKPAETPDFFSHKPNFKDIKKIAKRYDRYNNIIIIGNGGSIKSFLAFYNSLAEFKTKKNLAVLTTMEPSVVINLMKRFNKKDTLVMAISKSGNTVGVIENVLILKGYTTIVITSPNSALHNIARANNYELIEHPNIGGRFTGGSIVAYLPAALFSIKTEAIDLALRSYYKKFKKLDNDALKLAIALYLLEYNGYSEVFTPIYSHNLLEFGNIVVQLMHESVCKENKGLTFYSGEAPESQHHTSQRFFGGKRNAIGLFITLENHLEDLKISIDKKLQKININNIQLKNLNNNKLSKSLNAEFIGTYQDAIANKIPVANLSIPKLDEKSIGEFLGFCHLFTIYSAILRKVNPYDQPQVERSKEISLQLRNI